VAKVSSGLTASFVSLSAEVKSSESKQVVELVLPVFRSCKSALKCAASFNFRRVVSLLSSVFRLLIISRSATGTPRRK